MSRRETPAMKSGVKISLPQIMKEWPTLTSIKGMVSPMKKLAIMNPRARATEEGPRRKRHASRSGSIAESANDREIS